MRKEEIDVERARHAASNPQRARLARMEAVVDFLPAFLLIPTSFLVTSLAWRFRGTWLPLGSLIFFTLCMFAYIYMDSVQACLIGFASCPSSMYQRISSWVCGCCSCCSRLRCEFCRMPCSWSCNGMFACCFRACCRCKCRKSNPILAIANLSQGASVAEAAVDLTIVTEACKICMIRNTSQELHHVATGALAGVCIFNGASKYGLGRLTVTSSDTKHMASAVCLADNEVLLHTMKAAKKIVAEMRMPHHAERQVVSQIHISKHICFQVLQVPVESGPITILTVQIITGGPERSGEKGPGCTQNDAALLAVKRILTSLKIRHVIICPTEPLNVQRCDRILAGVTQLQSVGMHGLVTLWNSGPPKLGNLSFAVEATYCPA